MFWKIKPTGLLRRIYCLINCFRLQFFTQSSSQRIDHKKTAFKGFLPKLRNLADKTSKFKCPYVSLVVDAILRLILAKFYQICSPKDYQYLNNGLLIVFYWNIHYRSLEKLNLYCYYQFFQIIFNIIIIFSSSTAVHIFHFWSGFSYGIKNTRLRLWLN